jgi:hypothetical protein
MYRHFSKIFPRWQPLEETHNANIPSTIPKPLTPKNPSTHRTPTKIHFIFTFQYYSQLHATTGETLKMKLADLENKKELYFIEKSQKSLWDS